MIKAGMPAGFHDGYTEEIHEVYVGDMTEIENPKNIRWRGYWREDRYHGDDMTKDYSFDAVIHEIPENGGAYVIFPWDIRKEFGKGRVKVRALFDGVPYDGSIVNMGVKDENGEVCYVIGVLKSIRSTLGKADGDVVHVVISERTA